MLAVGVLPVPEGQPVDASGRMICDTGEDVSEPGLRIDVVEAGGDDEGVEHGGAMSASIGTGEGPVLPPHGDAAQRPLGGIVAEATARAAACRLR